MPPLAWLLVAIAAAVAAYATGWPAWRSARTRDATDTNSERYLAWRGRATRGPRPREGMTNAERRRVVAGVALALLASLALVAFFVTT
jgi:hypothetical protein